MAHGRDRTPYDKNRTPVNFHRAEVEKVLPSYMIDQYPNLVNLFDEYYTWLDSDNNFGGMIKNLYSSRDAVSVSDNLLKQLEDELLLGTAYFGGFQNKREAIKFSNTLYRSKGTKYSIEQFFRAFYNVDPQISYPKDKVFKVGPQIDPELSSTNTSGEQVKIPAGQLGPESDRKLTDDTIYQTLAILIRTSLPKSKWEEVYKLFVHPAGMYLGSEILLEAINLAWDGFEHNRERENNGAISIIQLDRGEQIPESVVLEAVAELLTAVYSSQTIIGEGDGTQAQLRQDVDTFFARAGLYLNDSATIDILSQGYTFRQLVSPNSIRFDDSDKTSNDITGAINFSQRGYTYSEVIDQVQRIADGLSVSDSDYTWLTKEKNGFDLTDFNQDGSTTASDVTLITDFSEGIVTSSPAAQLIWNNIAPRITPQSMYATFDQHFWDTGNLYDSEG